MRTYSNVPWNYKVAASVDSRFKALFGLIKKNKEVKTTLRYQNAINYWANCVCLEHLFKYVSPCVVKRLFKNEGLWVIFSHYKMLKRTITAFAPG